MPKNRFLAPKQTVFTLCRSHFGAVLKKGHSKSVQYHSSLITWFLLLQEASRLGYYIKNKDGGEYDNWCWPGKLNFTFLNDDHDKNQFTEENRVQKTYII